MCKFLSIILFGMFCSVEGQLLMQFVNDSLILTWTNLTIERKVVILTMPPSQGQRSEIVTAGRFIVENVLNFNMIYVDVMENRIWLPRETYKVNKIESAEGSSVNISWTIQKKVVTGMYHIYHFAENKSYERVINTQNGVAIYTAPRYVYHSRPNTPEYVLFEIRTITLADAGHYKGDPFIKNTLTAGEDAILVVHGKPKKPVIRGNNTVKVNSETILTCTSKSTSAPEYYQKYLTLTYSWFVNTSRLSRENRDIFRLKVTKEVKYNKYSCEVKDVLLSERSEQIRINPLYGPESVIISPQPNDEVSIHDGEVFGPYNCSSECKPPCTLQWKYRNVAGSFFNLTTSSSSSIYLPEKIVSKALMALIQCEVNGIEGKKVSDIQLNIQYLLEPKVFINGNLQNSYKVNENDPLRITCLVEGNPTPEVTLGNLTGVKISGKNQLNFTLSRKAQCSDTGNYSCEGKSNEFSSKYQSFSINVLCFPKLDDSMASMFKTKYGSMSGPDVFLVVAVPVIANPTPSLSMIKWSGRMSQLTSVQVSQRDNVVFKHWINCTISVPDPGSFGNYSLMYNGKLITDITVDAEDKPQPPLNFSWYSYAAGYINLTWVSKFNGGPKQFFILSRKEGSSWKIAQNLTDPGEGNMGYYDPGPLTPGQEYLYQLKSCNRINCSLSPMEIKVKVKAPPILSSSLFGDNTMLILIGASAAGFLLVVVLTGVVTMYCKTTKKSAPKKRNREERLSGTTVQDDTPADAVVYAAVDKSVLMKNRQQDDVVKSDVIKDQNDDNDTMYSEVIKHPKKQQTDEKKEKKKNEEKELKENNEEAGAYTSNDNSRSTNQDGLVYIDVEFARKPPCSDTKGRPVIHGEEEKTEYTFVDFTQKAPPVQETQENVK